MKFKHGYHSLQKKYTNTHMSTPEHIYQPPFIAYNLFFHVVQLSEFL